MSDKSERIAQLQSELDELLSDTADEIMETVSEAEQEVMEVADTVNDETKDAHESVTEATQEVEQAVEETAQETADELGHPELAEEIADHLFRKLEDAGKLPHQQSESHHEAHTVTEGVEQDIETAAPVVPEAQAEVTHTPDTPPEPQHWYYRKRKMFGRSL